MRILPLVVSVLLATGSWAQSTGKLTGSVTDDRGSALPGANIKVTGAQLSSPTGSVTDALGAYSTPSLPPGRYTGIASYVGYESITKTISVSSGSTTTTDFILKENVLCGDQINVSASRGSEKVLDAPAFVSIVDGEEMVAVPTMNVFESVRAEDGVDYIKTGLVQNATVIRGTTISTPRTVNLTNSGSSGESGPAEISTAATWCCSIVTSGHSPTGLSSRSAFTAHTAWAMCPSTSSQNWEAAKRYGDSRLTAIGTIRVF